jgi:hypothetical protein
VKAFQSIREAKDFLAARIATEAASEGIPLSEIERKMLYFSETDWTLPEMSAVSAEFDRDYDEHRYEQKISVLVSKIKAHQNDHDPDEKETWDAAVDKLSEGDHYLLVLIDPSPTESEPLPRPSHDILKLWFTAFGIVFGIFGLLGLVNWFFGPRVVAWVLDRNRSGVIVLIAIFAWVFRANLRGWLRSMLAR